MHNVSPQPPTGPKSFQLHRRASEQKGLAVAGRAYWWRLGRKIALMSAHGSTMASLIFLPLDFFYLAVGAAFNAGLTGRMLGWFLIGVPVGWVGAFVWAALLGLVILPAVYLGQRLIGEPIRRDTIGWVAGSAVALVGSTAGLVQLGFGPFPTTPAFGLVGMLVLQVAGSSLGIAAAQAGGYLGSLSALRRRRRDQKSDRQPIRFSLWRLLAVTALLSILLSLFRLTGDFALPLIVSALACSLIAWAIHRPVAWATNRWLDWRLKKRRAKRSPIPLAA